MPESNPTERYRFGVFEADVATGELRKQGLRIKVNVQPFQVLCLLLRRPGEVLTREDLSRELWPDGTFVDYEHGVNSAVNRIREALGDSAKSPRFIETLARRGYRFVAPVQRIDDGVAAPAQAPEPEVVAEGISFLATVEELPRTPHMTVKTLFVLLQVMYLGFYVGALANLGEIADIFGTLGWPGAALGGVIVTAALLIPVRAFMISAALLHPPGGRAKLLRLWMFVLPCDVLWALAPFLLVHHMPVGLAVGCMAALVYAPFAQRSLVLMGAGSGAA